MRRIDGICRNFAVIRLRHSSSSRPSVITLAPAPVRMVAMASTISVAPVPGVGFSIRCERRRAVDHAAQEAQQQQRHGVGALRRATNGKSPRSSSQMSSRAAATCASVGPRRDRRKLEAGRRHIEQPCIRVVAGLGQQLSVPAEDRGADDREQHRQSRVGRRQHRLHDRHRRLSRDELALAREPPPIGEPRQHVLQALLGHLTATGRPSSSGTTQVGDRGIAEEPGRAVGGGDQLPDFVDGPGKVALVGLHDRQRTLAAQKFSGRCRRSRDRLGVRHGGVDHLVHAAMHSGRRSFGGSVAGGRHPRGGGSGETSRSGRPIDAGAFRLVSFGGCAHCLFPSQSANFCRSSRLNARRMADR